MGFYIRKGLNFGPFRLNLSKSGAGFSFGGNGARIGINANGKSYIYAGRGGLYYRKQFNDKSNNITSNTGYEAIEMKHYKTELENLEVPDEITKIAMNNNSRDIFLIILFFPIECFWLLGIIASFANKEIPFLICFLPFLIFAIPYFKIPKIKKSLFLKNMFKDLCFEKYTKVLSRLEKCKKILPNNYCCMNFISELKLRCYNELNDFDNAIELISNDKYIENKEEKTINLYYFQNMYDEIIKYYETNKNQIDNDEYLKNYESFNYKIFMSYVHKREMEKALIIAQTKKIMKKTDKIIACCKSLGDYETLTNTLQTELKTSKELNIKYLSELANAFLEQGKNAIALETILQGPVNVRKMTKELCQFRYILAKCYEANGDIENAYKQYNKIYAFDKNFEDVEEIIETLSMNNEKD